MKESYDKCDKDWDEICLMNDDEIYPLFCPHTFRPRSRFAPVDYSYVQSELKKVGATEMLLWEEYCEKCNTEGVPHCCYATSANGYKRFIADKDYTSHIERKPGVTLEVDWPGPTMGYMASVEGAVGKIARKIIGMLRNETFYSIEGLNSAIRKALDKLNDKPFQKKNGSRKTIYELEEKPYLRPLPMLPFEICEWSYNHKVGPNSHIWFHKGQCSVPSNYINKYVDVRYNNSVVFIYASHKLIAEHKRIPTGIRDVKRTEMSHPPYPAYTPDTMESARNKAEAIGTVQGP